MKLKIRKIGLGAGRPIAFLHEEDARKLGLDVGERLEINFKKNRITATVDIVEKLIKKGQLALSQEAMNHINVKQGDAVKVNLALEPRSTRYILKKLEGEELSKKEILSIIKDIVNNALTEAEIAYFVSGVYENGMTLEETKHLTWAMFKTGNKLKWKGRTKIVDKHSIGGLAGNRTTPIVIPICAAAGLKIPKTSSRAITSAAGTADVIETIAKVDLPINKIKEITNKANACMVWGGAIKMAPADDKLIRIERLLSLDPESQLIASIISKKLAIGSKYVLIDIPYGKNAKVSKKEAKKLKIKFEKVGKHFNLNIKVILTDGSQPIGNGIGPTLEMKDALRVLEQNNSPKDLENKSILLAAEMLEMTRKAKKGKGKAMAREILKSGKALEKFNEIISLQGKNKNTLKTARYKHKILSKKAGKIKDINSKSISYIARVLGCPIDKTSGVYIHKHVSESVKKREVLLTLYAESNKKLKEAISIMDGVKPIQIS